MADILRPDRSPVTAAAVLPDHHPVMARVAVLQDRRRVKAVVVLQGNLAAVGDLQDHHPVMATEEVTAVAVMEGAGAEGAATVVVGKVVATTSSRTVSRNFSPASGSAPLRRQQRRAATEASRVSRHLRPHDPP
ncbi:MAG: hypothetical protein QOJ04_1495 [Caballeronia sp.]|jgi:hypothetical protein|nr:hypothetical protein [Caballeronia sp.]